MVPVGVLLIKDFMEIFLHYLGAVMRADIRRTFCHDPESSLSADEQFRSVESRRGLPSSSTCFDHFAIWKDDGLRFEDSDYG